MIKETAINELKYRLLEKINKNKRKSGRPKSVTNEECLDAIF